MIRRVLAATQLVLLVQARGYFPHAFALYVAFVVGALRFLVPEEAARLVLPVFLVSEPGMLGVTAVAAHRYLELGNQSASALQVTPLRTGEHLLALQLASALLATLAGVVTFAAVEGIDLRLAWLAPVLFAFAVLSGLLGFALSLRHPDFPRFILGAIPVLVIWQAPLLAAFDVVPSAGLIWIPSAPGILAIAALCAGGTPGPTLAAWLAAGVAVAGLAFVWVDRRYAQRLASGAVPA